MHNLRWDVFINRLGWKDGLTNVNFLEIDEYDNENAIYLIGQSEADDVTASVRLIPTNKSYMIKDYFSKFVFDGVCPENNKVFEVSRFCFSEASYKHGEAKPAASLAIACIEYGLLHGVESYIGLTNLSVKKLMVQIGWTHQPIGSAQLTPDNTMSIVCKYEVNEELLNTLKQKHQIKEDILFDRKCGALSVMEIYRNNKRQLQEHFISNDPDGYVQQDTLLTFWQSLLEEPSRENLEFTTCPQPS